MTRGFGQVESFTRLSDWPEKARAYLTERGITDEQVQRAGITYVTASQAAQLPGHAKHNYPGLRIPYLDDKSSPTNSCLLRPIPTVTGKFRNLVGWKPCLYLPPNEDGWKAACESDADLYVVEGPIKALRLTRAGYLTVGMNGTWGWKHRGKMIPDLVRFIHKHRKVILVPDSDADVKFEIGNAFISLAVAIDKLGAIALIKRIPPLDGHDKTGPDDYFEDQKGGGEKRFAELPALPFKDESFDDWRVRSEVTRLNERHAIVRIRGSLGYLVEPKDKSEPPDFLKRADFLGMYEGNRVVVGKTDRGIPIIKTEAQIWLESEHHRMYEGVVLDPGPDAPTDKYNLWAGWAFEPEAGHSWKLFENHIRAVICDDDENLAAWLLNWMAARVQQPWKKAGVVVVMGGMEGIGKSFTGQHFGKLYGRHCVEVTSDDDLLGTFNNHLAQAMLILAEEALFAGDKKHANMLKNFLTSEHLRINTKFISNYTITNRVALVMTSNEDWIIPPGPNARRFTVFDVNNKWQDDIAHFDKIRHQLEAGGYATMMYDLLNRDITIGPDPWKYYPTKGLYRQKRLTESLSQKFIFDCLVDGKIGDEKWGKLPRESVRFQYLTFLDFMKADKHEWQNLEIKLGMALEKFVGPIASERGKAEPNGKRPWLYALASLSDSRGRFEKATRTQYDWNTGEPK